MRPPNWSVLGRSGDPTPGDPVEVRTGGARYVGIADAIGRAAATMRTLAAGDSNVDSVKALLESRDKVVDSVGVAEGRYRAAGSALTAYATVLDRVQADTLQALHAAQAAAGDGSDAAGAQERFHQRMLDAKAAGDAEEQEAWEKKESAAKADAAHAAGAVAAQKQVVEQAVSERDRAARTAIEAITASTSNDGLNDGWWEDWGAKLTEWVAKIAEAIATIAGLLALIFCWVPILGQVLLVIAAVAGVVAALANILLAAKGEKSWGEAALSVVFAALGCIGVGGALRALGGLAKLGLKAGAKAAFKDMAGAFKGLIGATGRNSLDGLKGLSSHFRPSEGGAADGLVDDVARTGDEVASAKPRMGDTHPSDGFGMAPGETHMTKRDFEIRPPTDAEAARLDELAAIPDSPIVKIDGQFHLKDSIEVKFDADGYFREQPFSAADEYAPGVTYGDEYARQVNLQRNGMNDLTIGEWSHNVDHYADVGRLAKSEQAAARLEAGGQPGDFKAVLHGPDQVAGGRPDTFDGLGHSGINSSLGSQWKSLVADLQADVAAGAGGIDSDLLRFVHLNVRLTP